MAMSKIDLLVGSVRRLGRDGPPYEVIGHGTPCPDGAAQMRIRSVESGESVDYPVADILRDPLDA
jgi:Family of unknown function (DUF5397)